MNNHAPRPLLESAAQRAIRYLDSLTHRRVSPPRDAIDNLSKLDEPMPEFPMDAEDTIDRMDRLVTPATMAMAGGRFFGFVIGGALPVTVAANWLATAWDQNTGLYHSTPGTSRLEMVALEWLIDVLKLPKGSAGGFVTGATVANFTALAAARHAVLVNAGWNVEADGLFGAPPITVVVGAEAHPTLIKSLGLLGLGRKRVITIPVDNQGRMRVDALPSSLSSPAIVCVQAGNVNSGSFDPIEEVCSYARTNGAWVHVDGAFGLWAAVAPSLAHLATGIDMADSWATDGHKWLNVPYDCGLAFVRHPHALKAAMAITAEYLPTETEHRNPSDYTPELSRRARGVEVYAALRTLGRQGLAEMLERTCRLARRFAQGLTDAGYEVLNDVVLNQVVVSFGDEKKNRRVIQEIQEEGTCWCGETVWQGRTAMRISVCNWATTDDDVEKSLAVMLKIAGRQ
jgi:glutamate/tyrosine decarboxylase-like PLP-dependent enzyme